MDEFKEPLSRVEAILQNILGADNELSDPESRVEAILLSILNDTPYTDLPQSRVEEELLAIKNGGTYTRDILSKVEDILLYKLNNEKYPEKSLERVEELLIEWTDAVIEKTVSGSIISVTDAIATPLVSAEVDINPVQDLHGYDNPWPSGGGKNKLPRMTADSTNGLTVVINSDDSITVTGTATGSGGYITKELTLPTAISSDTPWTFSTKNPVPSTLRLFTSPGTADIGSGNTSVTVSNRALSKLTLYLFTTAGTSYNFTIYPQLELGSNVTSYSPYSNICPISGWNECNVTRAGKNLLESLFSDGKVPSISSGALVNANNACRSDYIPVNSGSVTFSCKNTSSRSIYCFLYGENKDFLLYGISTGNSVTVTHANAKYAMIRCDGGVTAPNESMLELGTTATSYSPYQGNLYAISLGQTVYGAKADITGGKMVVENMMVDMGTRTWNRTTSYSNPVFYANVVGKLKSNISLLCSAYKFSGNFSGAQGFSTSENASIGNCNANEQIFVRDDSYTDTTTFKSAMNGVQLVYDLATPITISLTPTQITMLQDNNVLYADTGDLTLTYKAKGE